MLRAAKVRAGGEGEGIVGALGAWRAWGAWACFRISHKGACNACRETEAFYL